MCDHPTAIMLFAAGLGTRMKHLTKDRPKPLIEVAGKPLIDHAIALTKPVAHDVIVANLHYMPHLLEQHLAPTNVQTLVESPEILETGGGLKNALPLLGNGPVITQNTDAIWKGPNPIETLLSAWDPQKMDALLLCIPIAQTHGYTGPGNFSIGTDGRLSRTGNLVYGGIQITKTDRLQNITETSFSLNVVWNQMIEDQKLFGLTYSGHWCDVGHPDGISIAEDMLNV